MPWIRRLQQCYTCTERYKGCGEYLDPRYASRYIQPCSGSCMIFRNPSDQNLMTRDCSSFWPEVRMRNGLQKLLGSDAFFCDETLCNGVGFDFLLGIFYNQVPAFIRYPPTNITTTTTSTAQSTTTTTTTTQSATTLLINPFDEDPYIWNDPDLDYDDLTTSQTTYEVPTSIYQLYPVTEHSPTIFWWWWNDTSTSEPMNDDRSRFTTALSRFERLSVDEENESSTLNVDISTQMMNSISIDNENRTTTELTMRNSSRTPESLYEYCKDQKCFHGGRLSSDCFCICLPAYTGETCQTVLCDQEPAHICNFVLEYECESESIRFLCPKFCSLPMCSSQITNVGESNEN